MWLKIVSRCSQDKLKSLKNERRLEKYLLILRESNMLGKLMEHMTWVEVEKSLRDLPFILMPLGARQKEHGHHLPLNTDYLLAKYFRDQALKKYEILSTGIIDINYFPAFTDYPGTEHLSEETATQLVYEKCKCYINHGVTHIYIINMGISTNKILEKVKQKLKAENVVLAYTDQKKCDNSPAVRGVETQIRGTHADELETSMILYIKPEVVMMEKAIQDDNDEIDPDIPGPLTRNPHASFGVYSASGVWGNPTLATTIKGEIVVDEYIKYINKEIGSLLDDCLKKMKEV